MIFFDNKNKFSFLSLDLNTYPQYRENNLIKNQNSFPFNLSLYNEQEEEENNLFNFSSSSDGLDCFNNIEEKKSILNDNLSISKISSPKEEKPKVKDINYFENNYSKTLFSSKKDINQGISLLEDKEKDFNDSPNSNPNGLNKFKKIFDIKKKIIFNIEKSKRNNLFPDIKINNDSIKEDNEKIFLGLKREKRKDDLDNIRTKIKRHFINTFIIEQQLNEKLTMIEESNKLYKFPDHLSRDVNKERNQKIFQMTLMEFLEEKELYKNIYHKKGNQKQEIEGKKAKKILERYRWNLEIIHSDKAKDNEELKKILNKKILHLYEEYINSAQFKIVEINRLKKKNFNDNYIESYIYLANHLIQFFEIKINE